VIYVVSGRARMRWGDRLGFVSEAGPGDFIYVPPYVQHQEINANAEEQLSCVVIRSDPRSVRLGATLGATRMNNLEMIRTRLDNR
jgi:uncharacterized RmlC-like cupin family protein